MGLLTNIPTCEKGFEAIFLVVPKHVMKSFEYKDTSIEELAEALENEDRDKLQNIANTISHKDIKDIISVTNEVMKFTSFQEDSTFRTAEAIGDLAMVINNDVETFNVYMNSISIEDSYYKHLLNEKISLESALQDDKYLKLIDIKIFNNVLVSVVDNDYLAYLKARNSFARQFLFAKLLNFESDLYGIDLVSKSRVLLNFIVNLTNRL